MGALPRAPAAVWLWAVGGGGFEITFVLLDRGPGTGRRAAAGFVLMFLDSGIGRIARAGCCTGVTLALLGIAGPGLLP